MEKWTIPQYTHKIRRVIMSCKTLDQLEIADKYCRILVVRRGRMEHRGCEWYSPAFDPRLADMLKFIKYDVMAKKLEIS